VIGDPFELGAAQVRTILSAITTVEGATTTAGIKAFKS
jgi:hypothetical protein